MTSFLPGVPTDHVIQRLSQAGGKEIESGKFASPESSAALAVNTFGWFVPRPQLLPPFPGLPAVSSPNRVEVEYSARFPWAGGRHPWLDAAIMTGTHLIGVESKRYEPYRDRKTVSLSTAYDRHVWGNEMGPFEQMRDRLRATKAPYQFLDEAQLVKHAFGLVTDGRRLKLRPALVYLFAEPRELNGRPIAASSFARHRAEIADFAEAVRGAEVDFLALSYREWIDGWAKQGADVNAHGRAVIEAFAP